MSKRRSWVSWFCGVLVSLSVGSAFAQTCDRDVQLTWTLPVQGIAQDGSTVTLGPTDLTAINIYVDGSQTQIAPGDATSAVVPDVSCGSHDFWVTAVHVTGPESLMSNVVVRDVQNPVTPNPPTLTDAILALATAVNDLARAVAAR